MSQRRFPPPWTVTALSQCHSGELTRAQKCCAWDHRQAAEANRGSGVKMNRKPKVWLVDDLPRNLKKFEENHRGHFDIKIFLNTRDVFALIEKGECPDALLCDVFFYESVKEAKRVENDVKKLAIRLKAAAAKAKASDPRRAKGIELMRQIYEHYGKRAPRFPIYAYTSKGPFLLEQKDWENISKYGAQVLLKNRVKPKAEREEIEDGIAIKARRSRTIFIGHGRSQAWVALKSFMAKLHLEYEEFNRVSAAGVTTRERLAEMLDRCGLALLVLTGEDVHEDQTTHARENVIHEVGLFQGRLGWRRAIPLLEDGCEEFSNIVGVNHIPFAKGNIKACFPKIRHVLEREGLLDAAASRP
jgi:predicted nucleotide-binding protein